MPFRPPAARDAEHFPPYVVRTNWSALYIGLLYLIVLVLPWGLTVHFSRGAGHGDPIDDARTVANLTRWTTAVDVLSVLSALVALPAIYALLARAAVVYSQRTSVKRTRIFNVRQLFSLADRRFVRDSWRSKESGGTKLAAFGAGLIALAFIAPILRFALVTHQTFHEPLLYSADDKENLKDYGITGQAGRGPKNDWLAEQVGVDPSLAQIARTPSLPYVLDKMRDFAATERFDLYHPDRQINYNADPHWIPARRFKDVVRTRGWRDPETGLRFASALAPGTATGWYRQTAMRLNSTVTCTMMEDDQARSSFNSLLEACLDSELSYRWDWEVEGEQAVRVCAPVNIHVSPWLQGRSGSGSRYRTDLLENAYIDMEILAKNAPESLVDRKVHCQVSTSLGWFELGNEFNGMQSGPLLNGIPTGIEEGFLELRHDFNGSASYSPSDFDHDVDVSPGPFGIYLISLFDQGSVLDGLRNYTYTERNITTNDTEQYKVCRDTRDQLMKGLAAHWPEDPCTDHSSDGPLEQRIRPGWRSTLVVSLLDPWYKHPDILEEHILRANQALLDTAVEWTGFDGPFAIWSTVGRQSYMPSISRTALIIVSFFIALQTVAVLVLVVYTVLFPVWTETLDAMAIARLAHRVKDHGYIRALGLRWIGRDRKLKKSSLWSVNALVGVADQSARELRPMPRRRRVEPQPQPPPSVFTSNAGNDNTGAMHPRTLPGADDQDELMGEPPAYTPRRQQQPSTETNSPAPPPYADDDSYHGSPLDVGGPGPVRRRLKALLPRRRRGAGYV